MIIEITDRFVKELLTNRVVELLVGSQCKLTAEGVRILEFIFVLFIPLLALIVAWVHSIRELLGFTRFTGLWGVKPVNICFKKNPTLFGSGAHRVRFSHGLLAEAKLVVRLASAAIFRSFEIVGVVLATSRVIIKVILARVSFAVFPSDIFAQWDNYLGLMVFAIIIRVIRDGLGSRYQQALLLFTP